MAEKYIYLRGKKIYVSDELYRENKKHKNHEAYLKRLDRKNRVYSLEEYAVSGDIADPRTFCWEDEKKFKTGI